LIILFSFHSNKCYLIVIRLKQKTKSKNMFRFINLNNDYKNLTRRYIFGGLF